MKKYRPCVLTTDLEDVGKTVVFLLPIWDLSIILEDYCDTSVVSFTLTLRKLTLRNMC